MSELSRTLYRLLHELHETTAAEINVTAEDIADLYAQQGGRCTITNLPMTHRPDSMLSISIDRFDDALGYVRGNVQLVCAAASRAKGDHSREDVLEFFRAARLSRVLVNCPVSILQTTFGVVMTGLAESIELDPRWANLRFYLGCMVGMNRSQTLYYFLSVFYGNNLQSVVDLRLDGQVMEVTHGKDSGQLEPEASHFDLSEPDSIGGLFECVGAAIAESLALQKSTGWEEFV